MCVEHVEWKLEWMIMEYAVMDVTSGITLDVRGYTWIHI